MNPSNGGGRGRAISESVPSRFAPVYPNVSDSLAIRRRDLWDMLAEIARQLRPFAIGKQEYCSLSDVMRRRHFSYRDLEIMVRVAARSPKPFLVEDAIRGAVFDEMAAPAPLCVVETFIDDTRAQSTADVAQSLFLVERTPVRRDQALDALGTQLHTLRQHKDAVLIWPDRRRS